MQRLFEILIKPLANFLKIKHIAIFQIDPSTGELIRIYTSGFSTESVHNLQDLKGKVDVLKRVVDTKIPQVVNHLSETEKSLSFLSKAEKLESLITVPIFSGEKLWGILTAFSPEKSKFQEDDAKIITLFAGQIGELVQLFSCSLRENIDELLVQVLGSVELFSFRYRNREAIPVSEILKAHQRLKNKILLCVAELEQKYTPFISLEEKTKKEELKLVYGNDLEIEEVITIEAEKKKPAQAKKVLVIDDESIVTDLLVSVLERMNYRSEVASCGREGVEKFEKEDFDLVITDLGMPDISGWEVSKAVKQKNPDVPVIVVTGWGIDPDPNKMKDSKVDYLINKPFQIDQLEKIIKKLLEK